MERTQLPHGPLAHLSRRGRGVFCWSEIKEHFPLSLCGQDRRAPVTEVPSILERWHFLCKGLSFPGSFEFRPKTGLGKVRGGKNPELYGIRECLKEAQHLGERQQGLDPEGQEGRMQT